ncbi:2-oxoglutarate dehydrogenase complex dihydrolipoyllysine-residue succinyltransferase [Polynucleobacter sp. IMCC30063]|uniref:2-oxoglutarate dehydrogenase complex dihydrolipoyllysine-residue succinyltransferase n=1 Tax=unclassified Polynucleobacter TaxID=2640945 RepID=UPI001F21A717|nr:MULTISPECIES: 2-oxoglutarate dehydrogenase complex dihydrolipoyllysine-residue succinyltransferase [unclassified Polynucleobacter]MCE7506185.1 2-oxoglutarate dehydrogenase complex dihydrolipoyllysine-residue succinyltransferase [Polynucleobacter sp. IMCC30063]MCE7527350.1 2-oxoglutarate dehydrogenase complex dihydrolipoyllysine-residue succinyltransferase [Polynucleobacter sp. IMCC 30228]
MSIFEVKVPQLSESVTEATLLKWRKKPGEAVAQDEILIEIETDKVVLEVPAPAAGVLTEILQPDGATVVAEQLIAKLDSVATPTVAAVPTASIVASAIAAPPATTPRASATVAAAPAAVKLMAELNTNAAAISGSGRDGRITKGDVLAAVATGGAKPVKAAQAALPPATMPLGDRPEERVPMSRLRARIAERLLESQANNAILTTFNEVNMAPVIAMRNKYKEVFEKTHGVKLGFMSFFVKAATHALKKFPLLNASVDGNDIIYHGYFDIGIAVSSPRGLVVPILRDVDQMNLAQIELKIAEFGVKAREGKLSIEELTGGTFSISNGGVFGSMLSTPIINPPQSAILGIHATKERAVVEDGQIVIRPINYLALSYDHRIIDGREAVLGLVAMKEAIEDPARLLLDL